MCNLNLSNCLWSSLLSCSNCFSFERSCDTWSMDSSAWVSTSFSLCCKLALELVALLSCFPRSSLMCFKWFNCVESTFDLSLYRSNSVFKFDIVCSNLWARAFDSSLHLRSRRLIDNSHVIGFITTYFAPTLCCAVNSCLSSCIDFWWASSQLSNR